MSDLAEIRRFWPRATCLPLSDGRLAWIPEKLCLIDLRVTKAGNYAVVRHDPRDAWEVVGFGDTIAAAMAAAGFGRRLPGIHAIWRRGDATAIKLESRQRPRKGVRLGKAKRLGRAAAELSIVLRLWDLGEQRRLDRGEIGR